ncbi:DUF302 domain-containing protein [Mycobacterium sp. ACS4331]|uniref:DUF302 domain-containing protein n=1 Tax=Mycobacterium sp. ACS4331 TaxID=1834121 RepID=UPI0007FCA70F|nr:DUF302 domain-containing protein [Mycobacterium sp. ACS4331]OBF29754.1 hypothetical protein A5727_23070 [Mycobacterium sp. ACS4331]
MPEVIPFSGVRLRYPSSKNFDALLAALHAAVGSEPAPVGEIAVQASDWDVFERSVQRYVGPFGFMVFTAIDHGAWIEKAGIDRKVLRVVIGNPLIAITMLRHDVTAGLFAPVELLLTSEASGSALTYVVPSSLMVVADNPALLEAATALDEKLAALAVAVTE